MLIAPVQVSLSTHILTGNHLVAYKTAIGNQMVPYWYG